MNDRMFALFTVVGAVVVTALVVAGVMLATIEPAADICPTRTTTITRNVIRGADLT